MNPIARAKATCMQSNGAACSHEDSQTRRRFRSKCPDPAADVKHPLDWADVEEPRRGQRHAEFSNQLGGRTTLQHWQESDIKLRVQLIRKLGHGTYGTCYSGKYKGERFPVAIKISSSSWLHKPVSATEVACLLRVQGHPNVIKLLDYFCSPFYIVLVMQLLQTDLYRALTEHTACGGFQPGVAVYVSLQLAQGIAKLHECSILHRDLHASNVLIDFAFDLQAGLAWAFKIKHIRRVCVADLGQACDTLGAEVHAPHSLHCGAHPIRPPEVVIKERAGKGSAPYGPPVDVWAIGVLLVMMLKGVAFVPASDSLSEYFEFWRKIIGSIELSLARRLGMTSQHLDKMKIRKVAGGVACVALAGGAACSQHLDVLKYDPAMRPTASRLTVVWEHVPEELERSWLAATQLCA